MPDRSYQQLAPRFLLTAGVLCVLTLTTIQTADASCGDYLAHTSQHDDIRSDLLHPPDQTPVQAPQKLPCSGPQCQNHRPDSAPESPVIVITVLKPACSLFSGTTARRELHSESMCDLSLVLPDAHRQRIDRPPQSSRT